jgi:hypothetical protein
VGSTALGTIRSVEYVIQNLDETAANLEQQIATTQKRLADLAAHVAQPFEYEERLSSLNRRQQEIEDALDLTKNQAGTQREDEASTDVPEIKSETEKEVA